MPSFLVEESTMGDCADMGSKKQAADDMEAATTVAYGVDPSMPWSALKFRRVQRGWLPFLITFREPDTETEYTRWAYGDDYVVSAIAILALCIQFVANALARLDWFLLATSLVALIFFVAEVLLCILPRPKDFRGRVAVMRRHLVIQRLTWFALGIMGLALRGFWYQCYVENPPFWTLAAACSRVLTPSQSIIIFCTAGCVRCVRWSWLILATTLLSAFVNFARNPPPKTSDFFYKWSFGVVFAMVCGLGTLVRDRSTRQHFATIIIVLAAQQEARKQRLDETAFLRCALPPRYLERLAVTRDAALWDTSKRALVIATSICDYARLETKQLLRDTLLQMHHLCTAFDEAVLRFGLDRATVFGDTYVVTSGLIATEFGVLRIDDGEAANAKGRRIALLEACRFVKWQLGLALPPVTSTASRVELHAAIACGDVSGGISGTGLLMYTLFGDAVDRATSLLARVPRGWCWLDHASSKLLPDDSEFSLGPSIAGANAHPLVVRQLCVDAGASSTFGSYLGLGATKSATHSLHSVKTNAEERLGIASLPPAVIDYDLAEHRINNYTGTLKLDEDEAAYRDSEDVQLRRLGPAVFVVLFFFVAALTFIVLSERVDDPATWAPTGPGARRIPDEQNVALFVLLGFTLLVACYFGPCVVIASVLKDVARRRRKQLQRCDPDAADGDSTEKSSDPDANPLVGQAPDGPTAAEEEGIISALLISATAFAKRKSARPPRAGGFSVSGFRRTLSMAGHQQTHNPVLNMLDVSASDNVPCGVDPIGRAVAANDSLRADSSTAGDPSAANALSGSGSGDMNAAGVSDLAILPGVAAFYHRHTAIMATWLLLVAIIFGAFYTWPRSLITNSTAAVVLTIGTLTANIVLRKLSWMLAFGICLCLIIAPTFGANWYQAGTGSSALTGTGMCAALLLLGAFTGGHRARLLFLITQHAAAVLNAVLANTVVLQEMAARQLPVHVTERGLRALRRAIERDEVDEESFDVECARPVRKPDRPLRLAVCDFFQDVIVVNVGIVSQGNVGIVSQGNVAASQSDGSDTMQVRLTTLMHDLGGAHFSCIQSLGAVLTFAGPFQRGDAELFAALEIVCLFMERASVLFPKTCISVGVALEEGAGAIVGSHSLRYRMYGIAARHSAELMQAGMLQLAVSAGVTASTTSCMFVTRRAYCTMTAAGTALVPARSGKWLAPRTWRLRNSGCLTVHTYAVSDTQRTRPHESESIVDQPNAVFAIEAQQSGSTIATASTDHR